MNSKQIQNSIDLLDKEFKILYEQYQNEALATIEGIKRSNTHLLNLETRISSITKELNTLEAARSAAIKREKKEDREAIAKENSQKIAEITEHLKARDIAAISLTEAISKICFKFQVMVTRSEKAKKACPIGTIWPTGSLCDFDTLKRLVEIEIARLDPSFPGGDMHEFSEPDTLVNLLKEATENTIAQIHNQR